ncbi:DgyrCDS3469 [Dimorphilus gyrociliatus]|uniref:DgyrCDS3469 n=1 Tax=Dimorphilus gyrociliatus TaxID=2664684 RepID=A0A7I8VF44_9ANNE|nr:DgyrCDS3469 [Dimorphilus gyrociliatus]
MALYIPPLAFREIEPLTRFSEFYTTMTLAYQRQNNNTSRKKTQVSYVIRDEEERRHRSGINSVQYDPYSHRLFTGGRDSVIRIWNVKQNQTHYIQSMEHHTDWINDIILCCSGRTLISASSDTTVKVWNAVKGFCMSTLRTHKDYVKALAYAKDKEQVASAGLDKSIFLWDVNTLTALTASNNTVTTSSLNGNKDSIYSVAMNPSGSVIVSGSAEKVLRVWDPRSCQKLMKLKGHSDNVKCLVLNRDGTQCLSGSSDGTIKLWSIGQQKCIHTFRVHTEGVWTLKTNQAFTVMYSGGRDCEVWSTDIRESEDSTFICKEKAPVLRVELQEDESNLWVSTTDSTMNCWSLKEKQDNNFVCSIPGGPSVRQYSILSGRRYFLTKDTDNNITKWDALTATKVKDLGDVSLEDEREKETRNNIYVPNWFTVDMKTGMPTVHLDENDCFSAWILARDADLNINTGDSNDAKVNLGTLTLKALFEHWPKTWQDGPDGEKLKGNGTFQIPKHTPIIISEAGNRTILRLLCRDAGGDTEQMLLKDSVPDWISSVLVDVGIKDRLSANDMLLVRKVMEHVYEKVLGQGSDAGSQTAASTATERSETDHDEDVSSIVEEKVELWCNENLLDPNLDLRTVKHLYWKQGGDLMLQYKPINLK